MTDTCIIGAGPAGLATARALKARGLPYTHLERHTGVGGLWDIDNPGTPLYESAHFISSKTLSGFSGYPMPDDYPDYPHHREILAYLKGFATRYGLTGAIRFGTEVTAVEPVDGRWRVTRADGTATEHAQVVAATGVQWHPNIPAVPGSFTGEVRHSVTYRSADEFRGRRVLVVGAGNSGCDIACDAARTADRAVLSLRRGYWFVPKHVFGIPVDVFAASGPKLPLWLEQRVFAVLLRVIVGDLTRLGLPRPDHKLFETHPLLNSQLIHHLQHGDVTARPAIADTSGTTVTFTDGTTEDVDLILLATGYRHRVRYAQALFGDEQHPDLYLTAFSRHPGLYGVGYIETNSGAYALMDAVAHLVAGHIADRTERPAQWTAFEERIRSDRPDLSGGIRFVNSPRHRGYVDSGALSSTCTRWPTNRAGRCREAAALPAGRPAGGGHRRGRRPQPGLRRTRRCPRRPVRPGGRPAGCGPGGRGGTARRDGAARGAGRRPDRPQRGRGADGRPGGQPRADRRPGQQHGNDLGGAV